MSASNVSMRLLRRILMSLLDLVEANLGITKEVRKQKLSDLFTIPSKVKIKAAAFEDVFPYAVPANDFLYDESKNEPTVTIELPGDAFQYSFAGVANGFIFRENYNLAQHMRTHSKIDFVFKGKETDHVSMSATFIYGLTVDYLSKFYDVSPNEEIRLTFNGKPQATKLRDPSLRNDQSKEYQHILVNLKRKKLRGLPLE